MSAWSLMFFTVIMQELQPAIALQIVGGPYAQEEECPQDWERKHPCRMVKERHKKADGRADSPGYAPESLRPLPGRSGAQPGREDLPVIRIRAHDIPENSRRRFGRVLRETLVSAGREIGG